MGNAEYVRMCWCFLTASQEEQQNALALLTEEEQETFLYCVGLFRILVDKDYHDRIMAETMRLYLESLKEV